MRTTALSLFISGASFYFLIWSPKFSSACHWIHPSRLLAQSTDLYTNSNLKTSVGWEYTGQIRGSKATVTIHAVLRLAVSTDSTTARMHNGTSMIWFLEIKSIKTLNLACKCLGDQFHNSINYIALACLPWQLPSTTTTFYRMFRWQDWQKNDEQCVS